MTETLILVKGGAIYRFLNHDTYEVWTAPSWLSTLTRSRKDRGRIVKLELGQPLRLTYHASSPDSECFDASPVLRWTTLYDSNGKLSFEEALYNAEWLEGYEYRVMMARTYTTHTLTPPENPYSMGTPEQKWFESGYYAAVKEQKQGCPCIAEDCPLNMRLKALEEKRMQQTSSLNFKPINLNLPVGAQYAICCRKDSPCPKHAELPDAKVEILLKLNERKTLANKKLSEQDAFVGASLRVNGIYTKALKDARELALEVSALDAAIKAVQSLA